MKFSGSWKCPSMTDIYDRHEDKPWIATLREKSTQSVYDFSSIQKVDDLSQKKWRFVTKFVLKKSILTKKTSIFWVEEKSYRFWVNFVNFFSRWNSTTLAKLYYSFLKFSSSAQNKFEAQICLFFFNIYFQFLPNQNDSIDSFLSFANRVYGVASTEAIKSLSKCMLSYHDES